MIKTILQIITFFIPLLAASVCFDYYYILDSRECMPIPLHFKQLYWQPFKNLSIKEHIYEIDNEHLAYKEPHKYALEGDYYYYMHFDLPNETREYNFIYNFINCTYIEMYRVYVNGIGGIFVDNKYYTMSYYKRWEHAERFHEWKGKVIGHCQALIVLGYDECRIFGHALEDIMQPMLMMPEDILKSAYVLSAGITNVLDEFFDLINIPKERRITLRSGQWISCDKVYTLTDPQIYLNYYGIPTFKLKQLFERSFKLSDIKPTKYYFTNRKQYRPRHIHNLDEIIDAAKKRFPAIEWDYINDTETSTLVAASKVWATAKFVFAPIGSNIVKCVFMKDNGVLVIPCTFHPDFSIAHFASACHIFSLHWREFKTSHISGIGEAISVWRSLDMIERGLICLKNRQWRKDFF